MLKVEENFLTGDLSISEKNNGLNKKWQTSRSL